MPTELFARRNEGTPALSITHLRERLADESGLPCDLEGDTDGNLEGGVDGMRCVFGEPGITMSLHADADGKAESAIVTFSSATEIKKVTQVCRAFRRLGWELGDVP